MSQIKFLLACRAEYICKRRKGINPISLYVGKKKITLPPIFIVRKNSNLFYSSFEFPETAISIKALRKKRIRSLVCYDLSGLVLSNPEQIFSAGFSVPNRISSLGLL